MRDHAGAMTSTDTSARTPVRVVAGSVAGLDTVLLLIATWLALDTFRLIHAQGDEALVSLGYLLAGLLAVPALPSLLLAVAALRTRGATAIACTLLSVLVLITAGVFVVSWI